MLADGMDRGVVCAGAGTEAMHTVPILFFSPFLGLLMVGDGGGGSGCCRGRGRNDSTLGNVGVENWVIITT